MTGRFVTSWEIRQTNEVRGRVLSLDLLCVKFDKVYVLSRLFLLNPGVELTS